MHRFIPIVLLALVFNAINVIGFTYAFVISLFTVYGRLTISAVVTVMLNNGGPTSPAVAGAWVDWAASS